MYRLLIYILFVFFQSSGDLRDLHSFPTRRSSDLPRTVRNSPSAISREMLRRTGVGPNDFATSWMLRSEEHTSELQSRGHLVCRLLLEKKKISSSPTSKRMMIHTPDTLTATVMHIT